MVVWFDLSLMMALIMRVGVFHKSIFFKKNTNNGVFLNPQQFSNFSQILIWSIVDGI